MKRNSIFLRVFAVLAITSLLVTNISGLTYADPSEGEFGFYNGLIIPDPIPEPTPIDPVPEPIPEPVPVHEHTFAPGQVIQQNNCVESGITRYYCTTCNYFEDRNEPAADPNLHVVGVPFIAAQPTCSSPGRSIYRCTICGQTVREESAPPATGEHVRDGGTTVQAATCVQEGIVSYHCAQCGCDMGTDTIPKTDHVSDSGTIVKKPTTTEPGEIEYKCVNCGTVLKEEQIPVIDKRPTPQATFDTESCTVLNIPENCTVTLNGNVISSSATGSVSLKSMFPQNGDYTIKVVANGNDSYADSDAQCILTHKPAAPSNIQTVPEKATGGGGAICGVDTNMEYKLQDGDSWITCASSSQPVSSGIYVVRYKATTTSIASDAREALVKKEAQKKPEKPSARFEGYTCILSNLSPGMVYSTNGGDTWTKVSDSSVRLSSDAANQAVSYKNIYVKNIVGGVESDIQAIAVGRVVQPTGLTTSPATNGNNGAIKHTDKDMQYRKEGSDTWIDIGSDTVSGLSKGKYYVRRKGNGSYLSSNPVDVYIDDKGSSTKEGTPSAQFNGYNMHIDGVYGCRISFDGGYNWTDVIYNSTYVVNETVPNASYGIIIYRPGNGITTSDSDRQYIALSKQPIPTGITATSATSSKPGTIVGTDLSMQYRGINQSSWIDINANAVAVTSGTYYLRRHGYGNTLPSDWLTIVINTTADVTPIKPTNTIPVDNKLNPKEETKKEEHREEKKEEKKEEVKQEAEEVEEIKEEEVKETALNNPSDPVTSDGISGWQAIEDTFAEATEPVVIRLNEATDIPAEVFEKAAETDTTLVFSAGNQAVWSVLPKDVSVADVSAIGKIDIGIRDAKDSIPEKAVASIKDESNGQKIDRTFKINHEGDFGFKAELTLKINSAKAGQYANLFWYNELAEQMVYIGSSVVNDKNEATFSMSHASSYVVVTSDTVMSQDSVKEITVSEVKDEKEDNTASETKESVQKTKKKASPMVYGLIIIIIALTIALIVVLFLKKNNAKKMNEIYHHNNHQKM